ncbi:hypothetical protein BV22DRAFT_1039549 [Leucogyrophana mollusca]|uniref:Uncharacterized protein n=1 Tax=Leucogyrophana mollusca TaxID=85980 RepID=A0ACB8B609_9AGAM|nr:hypothetical protein BV22DRAFT_1039549 [Leucogyrophana mollusca]
MYQVSKTQPEDWVYVSEGGATIVLAYAGLPNADFDGKVLRLRKTAISNTEESQLTDEPDDPTIAFQHGIIAKLIPPQHLPELEVVLLDAAWLKVLSDLRDVDRPVTRRQKDRIDLTRRKGVLATDLIGTADLAVEIKPKWGFLPTPTHLSPSTVSVKTQTCRFCRHNYLRSNKGKDIPSTYCPLDLYSGNRERVAKAVHDLWSGWCASDGSLNNCRLFAKGKMVKMSDPSAMKLLSESLATEGELSHLESSFTNAILDLLIDSPVLRTISYLQRSLDPLDIEGLATLCRRSHHTASELASTFSTLASGVPEPYFSDWEDFIHVFKTRYSSWDHTVPNCDHLKHYLMAYLLSATFKDCSIILRPILPSGKSSSGGTVTIIDLDVKSMGSLAKWEKLDREIVEFYREVKEPKRCVDARIA